jgi:primosomal protein N' (replication factor Y)
MLSKGHDFPGVTLVGILQADQGLAFPDPRAAERTFQLLTQVAGRAGRGDRPGRVLVQAYSVGHPAIDYAARHDYTGFAAVELEQRQELGNPPYGHLVLLRVLGLDPAVVQSEARALAETVAALAAEIRSKHSSSDPALVAVLGPAPSPIGRINRHTRWQILIRARQRPPLRWLLSRIRSHLGGHGSGRRRVMVLADVDPQSFL